MFRNFAKNKTTNLVKMATEIADFSYDDCCHTLLP